MRGDGTRILMFHRVRPDVPVAFGLPDCYRMRGTSLTPRELQFALDAAGPIISLQEVERALLEGLAPPPGSVLTFDDGYREHLEVVAPILVERGASATFYVATGLHGAGTAVAAVDAWYWLLDHAARVLASVPLPGGGVFSGRVDTLDGKMAWVAGAPKAALLDASPRAQREMLGTLSESVGCALPSGLAASLYLRPGEWVELVGLGMRVGAHSVSHPRLTRLGERALDEEVRRSIEAVAGGDAGVAFAYPDGDYDDRVRRRVRCAGAVSAVTCERGDVGAETELMRLPRWFVATPQASGSGGCAF